MSHNARTTPLHARVRLLSVAALAIGGAALVAAPATAEESTAFDFSGYTLG